MTTVGFTEYKTRFIEIPVAKIKQHKKCHCYATTDCKLNGVGYLTCGTFHRTANPLEMLFIKTFSQSL